ncbi:hypothetical protein SLEP1_g45408 [Rubroshorea leprosula]|uniref:KIB1-4 beta-propeller domain-containing protein n=1 Tax=Rubroshorea leprosula TaxID=152421 RepID=A0AAV5LJ26_9ROSI|nr:hypothetical protein SLEP1_g45408 [Rubroshorea leprosula]
MEEEARPRKLDFASPVLTPWLVSVHEEDYEKMTLCLIADGISIVRKVPYGYQNRDIISTSYQGWLILSDQKERYSLWNPLTLEFIHLPPLALRNTLHTKEEIRGAVLTSPLTSNHNHESTVILVEQNVPSLFFCKLGVGGDQRCLHWTQRFITVNHKVDADNYLRNPVNCNGRLYSQFNRFKLIEVDLHSEGLGFASRWLDMPRPKYMQDSVKVNGYLFESGGELFAIHLSLISVTIPWEEVISVQVSRLDVPANGWNKVESLEDIAFFVSAFSSFSCPALIGSGVEPNHINFQFLGDKSLYSFNMQDKTVSVSLPCPNLPLAWESFFFAIKRTSPTTTAIDDVQDQTRDVDDESKEIIKPDEIISEIVSEEVGQFAKLPLDTLDRIGRCLVLGDYMSFRAANKLCRLAAPPSSSLQGFHQGYNSCLLPPWLTYWQKGDDVCNFIDPLRVHGGKYLIHIPNNQSKDVTMCYSKEGWCVMLRGKDSIFLWNPFAKKTILLPNLAPAKCEEVSGCGFSCSPVSSDCVIAILLSNDLYRHCIDFFSLDNDGKGTRHRNIVAAFTFKEFRVTNHNNPTFYDGAFYFLGTKGNLAVVRKLDEEIFCQLLERPECPCDSFRQNFLLECDGKLLSVFVGSLGKWVRIFRLDFSEMVWVEVENLGNRSLYLSCFSSFATPSISGMENKVYFPRFYSDRLVYYSLDSRKFHCHGAQDILEDFYNTKMQLFSCWIQPSIP